MKKRTKQIAVGGLAVALTYVLCLMGAISVSGKLIAPGICGILLILVERYVSGRVAAVVYAASSLLLLLLPNRLTAIAYLFLLGYYPILCGALKKMPVLPRFILKFLLLTAVGCIAMFGGAAMLGLWQNPQFVRYYPALILGYYGLAAIYDAFLAGLRYMIETRWDGKLKKLLG